MRWPSLRDLRPDTSADYQEAAMAIARDMGIARVHLDAVFWGVRE